MEQDKRETELTERPLIEHDPDEPPIDRGPGPWRWVFPVIAAVVLSGCNQKVETARQECFSVVPSSGTAPYASILVDACSGKTWLLVRSRMSDKPDSSFTYQWLAIERLDYSYPVLTNN